MITTNDGYIQFNFTPTQNQVLITVNAPGTYYLEDVAVYKTANQTKYTPTTHEKVLPTFTNVENMSQSGTTVQSDPINWPRGGQSVQQVNKGDYIQFEIGSDALVNYYRATIGISYTPSGKDFGMDFNWYISGTTGEYQLYTAGVGRTRYITPYTIQNGNRYKIWRNNGNVEFYINDALNRSFPDMYPDRPMYLEVVFGDPNKKVENLYIYKEVVKTSNVVETTHLVAKGDYRYGFNGQEKEREITSGTYSAEFWMYESRLARRWNLDPMTSIAPGWSPYRAFFDNPIVYIDPNGLFETKKEAKKYQKEHNIDGKISRSKGKTGEYGLYQINDFKNQVSYERNSSLIEELPDIDGNLGDGVIATPIVSPKETKHWEVANTTIGVFGLSSGIKETIIEGGAALNRSTKIYNVNSTSLIRTYGVSGIKYLKYSKTLGVAGSVVSTGYAGYKVYEQYNKGGANEVFKHRDVWDAGIGTVGLGATGLAAFGIISNPIGWGIGIGALIYGGATLIYDAVNDSEKDK